MKKGRRETHNAAGSLERLSVPTPVAVPGDGGTFSGMASVLGSTAYGARGPTRFKAGAFAESLSARGNTLPLLWQHRDDQPIGKIALKETQEGLAAEGFITQNTFGKEVLALLRDSVPLGLSIGFNPGKVTMEKDAKSGEAYRLIHDAELHETSIVTFPADRAAKIRNVHRAALPILDKRPADVREWLSQIVDLIAVDESPEEVQEGRAFSSKNLKRMKDAVDALLDLVSIEEPDFVFSAAEARKPKAPETPLYVDGAPAPASTPQAQAAAALHAEIMRKLLAVETLEAQMLGVEVEEPSAKTFDQILAEQAEAERDSRMHWALMDSIRSILNDPKAENKGELVKTSVDQYLAAVGVKKTQADERGDS